MHFAPDHRPGIGFIDRYMPSASAEERDLAYERLCRLVAVFLKVCERLEREDRIREEKAGAIESGSRHSQSAI
jgi:hypothetical protein